MKKRVYLILVLAVITLGGLALFIPHKSQETIAPGEVTLFGTVTSGSSYQNEFGYGLTFELEGAGPWVIKIFHKDQKDRDLVLPVNPPYRTEEHLMIGEGYGKTAQQSVAAFPRTFDFLYRKQDIAPAWAALEKVLWPKSNQDLEEGTQSLSAFPTGKGTMEVVSVQYFPPLPGNPKAGAIEELKFKVHLTWGQK